MSNKILDGANEATRKRNPHLYAPAALAMQKESAAVNQAYLDAVDLIPKDERELHDQFIAYLRSHSRGPIPFVHSRMDRRSTIREGHPDVSVFFAGRCVFIEFKMPGKKLSAEQVKCCNELTLAGCPVATCYSLLEAIEFTREKLGL